MNLEINSRVDSMLRIIWAHDDLGLQAAECAVQFAFCAQHGGE